MTAILPACMAAWLCCKGRRQEAQGWPASCCPRSAGAFERLRPPVAKEAQPGWVTRSTGSERRLPPTAHPSAQLPGTACSPASLLGRHGGCQAIGFTVEACTWGCAPHGGVAALAPADWRAPTSRQRRTRPFCSAPHTLAALHKHAQALRSQPTAPAPPISLPAPNRGRCPPCSFTGGRRVPIGAPQARRARSASLTHHRPLPFCSPRTAPAALIGTSARPRVKPAVSKGRWAPRSARRCPLQLCARSRNTS